MRSALACIILLMVIEAGCVAPGAKMAATRSGVSGATLADDRRECEQEAWYLSEAQQREAQRIMSLAGLFEGVGWLGGLAGGAAATGSLVGAGAGTAAGVASSDGWPSRSGLDRDATFAQCMRWKGYTIRGE